MSEGISLLSRIFHYIRGPNPVHPSVWEGRLSPIVFRRFEDADLNQCVQLYSLNEEGRFPRGVGEKYRNSLIEQESYYLAVKRKGESLLRVACPTWCERTLRCSVTDLWNLSTKARE
jgi:hypothetical protein